MPSDLTLLVNPEEYNVWARAAFDDYGGRAGDESPLNYPCWAFVVVRDWRYEETEPRYLYENDVRDMLAALAAPRGA